jgi:hypothetical protein
MNVDAQPDTGLPSQVEAGLSQMLADWADRYAVTPATAEAIRRAILETPRVEAWPAFGYEWWQEVLEPLARLVAQVHVPAAAVPTVADVAGTGAPRPLRLRPQREGRGGARYRPYLRLT